MADFYRLSEHVYLKAFDPDRDIPHIGVISDGKESLLYDLGTGPKSFSGLLRSIEEAGLPLPKGAVVSHYHWDHSFASGLFDGVLYGSAFTAERMELMLNSSFSSLEDLIDEDLLMPAFCREHLHMEYDDISGVKLRGIDVVVSDCVLKAGDVEVEIREVVSPHCEGQLVAYVPADKVLFIGDSSTERITGFDFVDDPLKRKLYFEALKDLDFEYVVHGHVEVFKRADFLKLAEGYM